MNCGHLFNGIGGFPLAASWMGWSNIMHCEIDSFCNRVMKHHFPNSFQHEDIRTTDFRIWRGRIDLLTGGFPCQPYSTAGKRKGTADDRHLWPEMLRAIREISPRWIVGENVRGLINWNRGVVFDEVQADLEAAGYEVTPFLLPAAGLNAPHRRDRIWFVAYSESGDALGKGGGSNKGKQNFKGFGGRLRDELGGNVTDGATANTNNGVYADGLDGGGDNSKAEGGKSEDEQQAQWGKNGQRVWAESGTGRENVANTSGNGQQGPRRSLESCSSTEDGDWEASWSINAGRWPIESPVCTGDDGIPLGLADISFSDWVEAGLTALGNAIVPQVAYELFKAIEQYENTK